MVEPIQIVRGNRHYSGEPLHGGKFIIASHWEMCKNIANKIGRLPTEKELGELFIKHPAAFSNGWYWSSEESKEHPFYAIAKHFPSDNSGAFYMIMDLNAVAIVDEVIKK